MIELETQQKMSTLQAKNEIAKEKIKQHSMDYAVSTFEEKTKELANLFSREVVKMLKQYNRIRETAFQKEEMLTKAIRIINQHESIITELNMFIQSTLSPFLDFLNEKMAGVCARYKEAKGQEMDEEVKNDPFKVFDLYTAQIIAFPEDESKAKL